MMSLGRGTRKSFHGNVHRSPAGRRRGMSPWDIVVGVRGRSSRQFRVAVAIAGAPRRGACPRQAQQPADDPGPLSSDPPATAPPRRRSWQKAATLPRPRIGRPGWRARRVPGRDCRPRRAVPGDRRGPAAPRVPRRGARLRDRARRRGGVRLADHDPGPSRAEPPGPPPTPPHLAPSRASIDGAPSSPREVPAPVDSAVVRLELGAAIDVGVGADAADCTPRRRAADCRGPRPAGADRRGPPRAAARRRHRRRRSPDRVAASPSTPAYASASTPAELAPYAELGSAPRCSR